MALLIASGLAIPQMTEWQRIGNQMKAAMIRAGADFVNVHFPKARLHLARHATAERGESAGR